MSLVCAFSHCSVAKHWQFCKQPERSNSELSDSGLTSSVQVRYSRHKDSHTPIFKSWTWSDLRQLLGAAKWLPRTPFLALFMPKEVVAKSSYNWLMCFISEQGSDRQLCWWLHPSKDGVQSWRRDVFPSSSTSASPLAETPVFHSPSHLVILEEFCFPLHRSKTHSAYKDPNSPTCFLEHRRCVS